MRTSVLLISFLILAMLITVSCAGAPTLPPTDTPHPTQAAPPTQTALPPTITPTPDPHVAGADCAKCHTEEHKRWATTLHAAQPQDVLLNTEHNTSELLTDECITCHAPFEAGKFKIGDFVQPVDQKGPWKLVGANASKWEAIKCEVCHDPTSKAPQKLAFWDSSAGAYVTVADTTTLCEKCHQAGTDDSRDLKGSVHEGLQCTKCHFQPGSEMSLNPAGACAQCHPAVNPKHPDVTMLDTTYKSKDSPNDIHFLTCKTCHVNGTPTPKP